MCIRDSYRKELEFSTELKEEPVYEAPQKEKQAEEKFEIVVADVLNEHMDRYNAYKEQLAAEAEAAAAEDTTTDTTTDSTTDTSTAETTSNMAVMTGR